jgi:hypothetical protein
MGEIWKDIKDETKSCEPRKLKIYIVREKKGPNLGEDIGVVLNMWRQQEKI